MGYDIHIERDPPLTLAESKAAVQSTDGVRFSATGAGKLNAQINGDEGEQYD